MAGDFARPGISIDCPKTIPSPCAHSNHGMPRVVGRGVGMTRKRFQSPPIGMFHLLACAGPCAPEYGAGGGHSAMSTGVVM